MLRNIEAPGDTILVMGCAGFIGHGVVRALLARGERVVGLDRLNAYYDAQLKKARLAECMAPGFTFLHIDLVGKRAVSDLFRAHRPARLMGTARRLSRATGKAAHRHHPSTSRYLPYAQQKLILRE
jgi:nucleoside-diphosphate-sugar epimerase